MSRYKSAADAVRMSAEGTVEGRFPHAWGRFLHTCQRACISCNASI